MYAAASLSGEWWERGSRGEGVGVSGKEEEMNRGWRRGELQGGKFI
jgi:hypothetical protein